MKSKMRKNQIPVLEGSGNVFADLRLADADDLPFKAELARQICNRLKKLRLTQVQAATRLGLKQPDVSKLVNGRHTGFSVDRLIALLNKLQVDVEIVLRPHLKFAGHRGTISGPGGCGVSHGAVIVRRRAIWQARLRISPIP